MNPQTSQDAAKKPNGKGAAAAKPEPSAGELAELFPAPRMMTIAGRAIEFKPCGLAQAGRIVDVGRSLYLLHVEGGVSLFALLEDEPERATDLIVAATELEREWVRDLPPDEKLELVSAWLEVNGGFFFLRLLPRMTRFGSAVAAVLGGGRTSSVT